MSRLTHLATPALWLAAVILAGGLIIGVVTLAVRWPPPPASWGFTGFQIPIAIAFGAMGILLLRRQPGNRIGWLLPLGRGSCPSRRSRPCSSCSPTGGR